MLFTTFMLMNDKKKRIGMVKRICLNPMFVVCTTITNCFWFIIHFNECCLLQTNVIQVMEQQSVKSRWST